MKSSMAERDIVDQVLDGSYFLDDEFREYCIEHDVNFDLREGCKLCESEEDK